jgi:ParB-like chromosome segregation protein Spo0J
VAQKITGIHPYADKFPMLPEEELAELAQSVSANGLRLPIVITPEGLILDGRNRNVACERVGVEPTTQVYRGTDLAEYVIDANSTRRNMSTGARAMATALVLKEAGRRVAGRWVGWSRSRTLEDSPKLPGEQKALQQAGIILDHKPDLAEPVVNGDLALDAAYRKACDKRDSALRAEAKAAREAEEEDKAKAFIEENAPDLGKKVGKGDIQNYVEALAIWEKRNREEAAKIAAKEAEEERDRRLGIEADKRLRMGLFADITSIIGAVRLGAEIDLPGLCDMLSTSIKTLEEEIG